MNGKIIKNNSNNVAILFVALGFFVSAHSAIAANFDSAVQDFAGNDTPTYGNISWNPEAQPSGTSIKMRVRTSGSATMVGALAFDDNCNVNNNSSVNINADTGLDNPCVNDNDQFVQFEAVMTTDTGLNVPTLSNVVISTKVGYEKTSFLNLISSPFDSGNANNSVQKLTWTASNDTTEGTVQTQIRTSADNVTWGPWCGPTNCSTTTNSTTEFASDYYTDKTGATDINDAQKDHSNDQWIQYATFLKSTDGDVSPTISNVTTQYAYNVPPAISAVGYTQNADGTVSVPYTLSETYDDLGNIAHGTAVSPIKALLVYQPKTDVTMPALTNSQTGIVTLSNPSSMPLPSQGTMIVDDELIAFDSVGATGNQRNITLRAQTFATSFPTTAVSHSADAPVFFVATRKTDASQLIHTIDTLTATGTAGTSATINNAFTWDPKNDQYLNLNSSKLTGIVFKVVANDADSLNLNTIGQSSATSAQTLDFERPTVSTLTTTTANGNYKAGESIPLLVTFSENVNFDPTASGGGKTITLTLNSGVCTIASAISNTNTATCTYNVGSSDNTPSGQYLKVDSIATTGIITDGFSNQQTDFTIPAAQNIDQDGAKQITIDTAQPTADDLNSGNVKFANALFSQTVSNVSDNSGSGIQSYQWSKTSGTGTVTFSAATSATTNISLLTNGSEDGSYDIQVRITDNAGNTTDKTMILIWDTTDPAAAGKPSVPAFTNDNTPTITWDQATDAGSGLAKYEVQRKTGTGGTFATVATITDETTLTATSPSYTETTLSDEAYYYQIITTDKAGNVSTSSVSDSMTVDTVAPTLSYFTSSTDNTCGATACGTAVDDMNITAVMSETILSGNMVARLFNAANPATDVTLNQISGENVAGIYDILGPNLGHDTDDLAIASVQSSTLTDRAGNVQTDLSISTGQNLSDSKNIVIDTGPPVLDAFSVPAGTYSEGDSFVVTADYSERLSTLGGGSSIDVTFEGGKTLTLNAITNDKLTGTYLVAAGENADILTVTQINSQNAVDLIGNPLTTGDLPPTNIAGVQVDTTAPTLGATPISFATAITNSQNPQINLSATDNFDLSDGTMQFSLNGGTFWCAAIPYADATTSFDITSTICGGSSSNTLPDPLSNIDPKTVTVKFIDKAGNESATASATIEYDNSKPILQKITAEQGTGIYGPTNQIKLIAQYNEALITGSTLAVILNNGKQITLDTIENTNQLTATYTIGSTGSVEDTNKLRAASIVTQSVSDTATPTNTQDSTSLAGITENIDADNKSIEIDTTAPAGSVVVDRSKSSGQIHIDATDANDADMETQIVALATHEGACDFTSATWVSYAGNIDTDLAENSSSARKVCVRFRDSLGNVSEEISAITPETPLGTQIDDISNSEINFYGSMLTWSIPIIKGTNNEFKQYEVLKCAGDGDVATDSDCTPTFDAQDATKTIADLITNYYVDTGLVVDRKYCYQVRFKDNYGNYSKLPTPPTCFDAGTAPIDTDSDVAIVSGSADDVLITDVTDSSARIIFQTFDSNTSRQLATNAVIKAYTNAAMTEGEVITAEELGTFSVRHSMVLSGLESGQTYYLKIFAYQSADTDRTDPGILEYDANMVPKLSFDTVGALSEITIDEDQPSIVTDTRAVIDFTTDQNAKCYVEYKESAISQYNELLPPPESEAKKNHSITITGLLPEREYDYKITCVDSINTNNIITKGATEDDLLPSFTTLEEGVMGDGETGGGILPEISSVVLSEITGESTTVTWNTNKKANSLVLYEVDGSDFTIVAGDSVVISDIANYSTAHSVIVGNLIPATKYTFVAMSSDASGNIVQSAISSFTTKQPSGLSSVSVVSKALGQATVTWTTGQSVSSLVEYGLTTSYGDSKESGTKTKEHELTITDLKPGEEYHLRVKGTSETGELFASSDITFLPKSPPKISDFKIDEITEHGATIAFTTNVPTDSLVTYIDADDQSNSGFQGKPEVATKHEMQLKNMESGKTYGVKLKVRDEDGNETEETFQNFTTTKDENPPKIDRVKTDAALTQNDKVQAIISWTTDELSSGKVTYKEGKTGEERIFNVNDSPSFSHVGVITSFKPGVVYYFNAVSTDVAENTAKSNDFALLTPKQKQNIIQVIIGNFTSIFNWTGNIGK